MVSGIITLTRSGYGEMFGQIVWSSVSNGTEANTSTVTATIQVRRTAPYVTTGTWRGNIQVGDITESFAIYHDVTSSWLTLKTVTTTISHNNDGSGSCYIYGTIKGPGATSMEYTSTTGSETVTLDTIPRYATLTGAPNFNDEENPTITYSNPAGNSITSLRACISLNGSKDDIVYRDISKTGTSYTFSLTAAERDTLRAATAEANSRTVIFFVRSEIGSALNHSTLSRTLTIKNPYPTINPTITDSNSATIALTGDSSKLVRYYSNAAITMGAAAVKKASLKSQQVVCGNKSLTANGTMSAVESNSFVFTATDSRGNTTTKTVTPAFVNYVKLSCSLGNNMPDGEGNMIVAVTGNYFNGSFGAKSNSLNVYYRYKTAGGSYGQWVAMTVTKSGNTYSATTNLTGLDYKTTYVFQTYAKDELATVYSAEKSIKATPVFDWSGSDFQFNVPVNMKNGCDIMKNGEVAYAPYGLNGEAIQSVASTEQLNSALATAYNSMADNTVKFKAIAINYSTSPLSGGAWQFMINRTGADYGMIFGSCYNHSGFAYRILYEGTWGDWQKYSPSNFAPAGYGLGASSIHSLKFVYNEAQAKAISETGWYCYNGASLATGCSSPGIILAEIITDLYKILHFRDVQGFELVNTFVYDKWTGWEWENPVMVPGVEYRTRERYDVNPVYTQLVDLGTTSTDYSATVNIPGITRLIRAVPVLDNRICTDWDVDAGVHTNNQFYFCPEKLAETVVFYMHCGSYRTGKNLKAQIWYTK